MNVTTTTHNGSGGKGGADPPNFRTSFEEKLLVSKRALLVMMSLQRTN